MKNNANTHKNKNKNKNKNKKYKQNIVSRQFLQARDRLSVGSQEQERRLIEKIVSLEREIASLEHPCSVCQDAKKDVVFEPCNHLACCQKCAESLTQCCICRQKISKKVTVYQ